MQVTEPADAPPTDETSLDEVGRAFEFLTFLDVKPEAEIPGEALGEARFELTDNLAIVVRPRKDGETIWITLAAEGDDEAARLNARWRGWAYQVGPWKEKSFVPLMADLRAPGADPAGRRDARLTMRPHAAPHAADAGAPGYAAAAAVTGREYPDRPWVGIGCIVFRGEQVLLVRRGKPPRIGQWSLPGGAQHVGETAEAAARRELHRGNRHRGRTPGAGHGRRCDHAMTTRAARCYHYTIIDFAAVWVAGEAARRATMSARSPGRGRSELASYALTPATHLAIAAAREALLRA